MDQAFTQELLHYCMAFWQIPISHQTINTAGLQSPTMAKALHRRIRSVTPSVIPCSFNKQPLVASIHMDSFRYMIKVISIVKRSAPPLSFVVFGTPLKCSGFFFFFFFSLSLIPIELLDFFVFLSRMINTWHCNV